MKTLRKRPSSRDVAQAAGVSQATVSRVLSDHPHVSSDKRERVLRAIEACDYQPNAVARAMKTRLSGTVGVVVSRITNPVVPELLLRLGAALSQRGNPMVVWSTDSDGDDAVIAALRQSVVSGLIFTSATSHSAALAEALRADADVVLLNRVVENAACDAVASDNHDGARRLALYLAGCSRRRFALVNGPHDRSTLKEREQGLRAGLAQLGLAVAPHHYLKASFAHDVFRDAGVTLMQRADPPDVICCMNDVIAFGVLCGLKAAGIRVPQDVWVTGFDGTEMAAWDLMDLTTVRQPLETMATVAVDRLLKRLAGERPMPSITRFDTELVIRGTTANTPLPIGES